LLASRENLLALLTTIIARKAARKARGPDLTGVEEGSLLEELAEESGDSPLEQALLNDCYQRFVGELPETLRPIAEMSLAGMTHREIAAAIPCAVRTVERKMARIMARWQEMAATSAE
jgi:DNA-directed RNA polymerase specialized sigma24 family protein